MTKKIITLISSLVLALSLCIATVSIAAGADSASGSENSSAEPTVFSADFSSLPNGAVDDNDTATVKYLRDRFGFYFYQRFTWVFNDDKPLMSYFERSGVNGFLVDDTDSKCWRFPDTAGMLNHIIDGQPSTEGHGDVHNDGEYYAWDKIPTWTIEDEWIYCTAYSGQKATPFRQANLMYIKGNTENGLANIKNFDLQMDIMFHELNNDTIAYGKDNFAVIFDGATAGNVNTDTQLMFAVAPDGTYFLGKPNERTATTCNEQFKDSNGKRVVFERGKKYHVSLRHVGNNVDIVISNTAGKTVVQHSATVPTILSGVGGNLAITGSNAGAKYANIKLTRLDDNAVAYDFDNRANGYQFGFTAREVGTVLAPYWSGTDWDDPALVLRNSNSLYWSSKYYSGYSDRLFYTPDPTAGMRINFNDGAPLKAYSKKMGEMFSVYHDAVKDGTHYYAKAPEFNSYHEESGIGNSYFGITWLSLSKTNSLALMVYLNKSYVPENLLDQTMSLVPKTSDGKELQTKNFKTQFVTRLPESEKSAVSLSFRSKTAGAMIADATKKGYNNKVTFYITKDGYYLDNGSGDVSNNGAPDKWTEWDNAVNNVDDVTVDAKIVNDKFEVRIVATNGTVLLNKIFDIPNGESGYVYYSAADAHAYFYAIDCDRLDDDGNIDHYNGEGHTLVKHEAKSATCTEEGNIEYYACTVCSKKFKDADGTEELKTSDIVIPKKSHSLKKTEAKAATYEDDGNIEYYTCESCGKLFKDEEGKEEITVSETVIEKLKREDTDNGGGNKNDGSSNNNNGNTVDQGNKGSIIPKTGELFRLTALVVLFIASAATVFLFVAKKKKVNFAKKF